MSSVRCPINLALNKNAYDLLARLTAIYDIQIFIYTSVRILGSRSEASGAEMVFVDEVGGAIGVLGDLHYCHLGSTME
jgi:hypothetical protein